MCIYISLFWGLGDQTVLIRGLTVQNDYNHVRADSEESSLAQAGVRGDCR